MRAYFIPADLFNKTSLTPTCRLLSARPVTSGPQDRLVYTPMLPIVRRYMAKIEPRRI